MWKTAFKKFESIFVSINLLSIFNNDCSRNKRKIKQIQKESFVDELVLFIFPYQTNGNHTTELSTVGHVISERYWKSISDFTEIVHNYELKWGTVCQIAIFNSNFCLKLYIQIWKKLHSMVLGSLGRDYCKN